MNAASDKLESGFLAKWTLVTSAGCILSLPIAYFASLFTGGDLVAAVYHGAVVGFAQWLFLRKRFPVSGWWVAACAIGLGVPFFAGAIVYHVELLSHIARGTGGKILVLTTLGMIGGFLTGVLQAPLLKPHFVKVSGWILASTVGWGLCLLAGSSIETLIALASASLAGSSNLVVGVVTGLTAFVGGLLFSIPLGVVTGVGLLWLARRHVPSGFVAGEMSVR